jgi:hypothetical protein
LLSLRLVGVNLPLAAFLVTQMVAHASAQNAGVAPLMYTKAPPYTSQPTQSGQANDATVAAYGQAGAGAIMPIIPPGPLAPQPSAALSGDMTVSGTGLAVTNGYANRYVAEFAGNWYYSGLGLHLDTGGEWREEDAGFVIAGLSYAITPDIRPKFLYGTSSENSAIQAQTYIRGEVEFRTPSVPGTVGVVATPAVTYREFRNGVQEFTPEIDVALYHPEFADHAYFVTEAKATPIFIQGVSEVGYELGASTTYVMPGWGNIGAEVFGGRMVWDVTLCVALCNEQNRFVGVRPLVSFYLNHNDALELFLRGEIVATDFYNIYGGTVGLKFKF